MSTKVKKIKSKTVRLNYVYSFYDWGTHIINGSTPKDLSFHRAGHGSINEGFGTLMGIFEDKFKDFKTGSKVTITITIKEK